MRRVRALSALLLLALFEATSLHALRGASQVERWRVDWPHLGEWMRATPTSDALTGVVVSVGLAAVIWLSLSTVLSALAAVSRVPSLMKAADLFTLPGVQRIVQRSMAIGLAGQAVLMSHGAAFAQAPAGGWTTTPVAVEATTPVAVAPTPVTEGTWGVSDGDNLWDIAAETIAHSTGRTIDEVTNEEILPYWQELMAAATPPSGDVNLIYEGERYDLPAFAASIANQAAAPVETEPVVEPAPVAAAPVAAPEPVEVTAPVAQPVEDELPADLPTQTTVADPPAEAPVAADAVSTSNRSVVGSGTLMLGTVGATGLMLALARRRRRRSRTRGVDEVLPEASGPAQVVEERVLRAVDTGRVDFVEAALKVLGAAVAVAGDATNPPVGLILSADQVDVVMAEPGVAPAPFRGRGAHWTLHRSTELPRVEAGPMPLPALVSLGRTVADEEVLVDLEDPGMISLTGDGAEQVVMSAAIQLAAAPWSDVVSVFVVGGQGPALPNVTSVAGLDEIMDELEAEAERTTRLLREEACHSGVFEARIRRLAPETWVPTVVLCVTPPPPHVIRRLVTLVSSAEGRGVSAFVAGHVDDSPLELAITHDGIRVEVLGVTVKTASRCTESDAHLVDELLDIAAQTPMAAPLVVDEPDELAAPLGPVEPEVIVHLYGAPGAIGLVKEIDLAKVTEMLLYLVCHRHDEVDSDRLIDALWPESDPKGKSGTFNNYTLQLRQATGHSPDGQPRFPKPGNRRLYELALCVVSTVELLERAIAESHRLPSEAAKAGLRKALEWVRGRPFDSTSKAGYQWAYGENHARHAVQVAGNAAHRLVELALESTGDFVGEADLAAAEFAIRQGQLADPDSEMLRVDEMRLAHARRDWSARDAVWAAVEEAAAGDDDEPGPVAAAAYRALLEDQELVEAVG